METSKFISFCCGISAYAFCVALFKHDGAFFLASFLAALIAFGFWLD